MKYPKVEEAKRAVASGMIKFYPARWEKNIFAWLENIKGLVYQPSIVVGAQNPCMVQKRCRPQRFNTSAHSVEPPADIENWEQDEDVLDTWYSSWLWPFGTLVGQTLTK